MGEGWHRHAAARARAAAGVHPWLPTPATYSTYPFVSSIRSVRVVLYTGSMKTCSKCKALQPLDAFSPAKKGRLGLQSWCKRCKRAQNQAYRDSDPEAHRARSRNYTRQLREQILDALGGECALCGYNANRLGLEIDHVAEDGAEDRRTRVNGLARHAYYRHLLRCIEAGDHGLQVLCGTCHSIKTRTARRRGND